MHILQHLTDVQQQAVTHIDGPLLILAGPGSGKTRVVTHRIAYMLQQGIPAHQIVALTFTNKSADEMRTRLDSLTPGQNVWMGTFHRFCARLLRQYATMVGLAENYSIYDTQDSKQALKRAIETAQISTSHTSPEKIAMVISRAKNRLITAELMQTQRLRHNEKVAASVYPVYQKQLKTANAVDFDDLLLYTATLLQENPELRKQLDHRYRYILVDEYQDTNLAQYAIVRSLSIDQPNLSVTGDPDQSIYGWRGADLSNILDFEKDYPNVKTVRLERNYRSTPSILRVADQLIRHNTRRKHKELKADRQQDAPVTLRMYDEGGDEANDIADQIVTAIDQQGARASEFAVLYRMNALTRGIEQAFRSRGLPYQIVNGLEFYKRKEIKDLLAYLQLINNPAHDVAMLRVINTPTRGIGKKTVERICQHADRHSLTLVEAAREAKSIVNLPNRSATKVTRFVSLFDRLKANATDGVENLLNHVIEETDYREYLAKHATDDQQNSPDANVDELLAAAAEFDNQFPEEGSLELFLEQVALVSDTDAWESSQDRVTLMTLHAAKGLEFSQVFIIAVEDERLPHFHCKDDPFLVEEERRLLFVGITRAKDRLQLSYCKRRFTHGSRRPVVGSPFLMELPLEEMRRIEPDPTIEYLDDDTDDFGYPDSWDLPDDEQEYDQSVDVSSRSVDSPLGNTSHQNDPSLDSAPSALPKGITTAAKLLKQKSDQQPSVSDFQKGMAVRHTEYGVGRIVAINGRGPKRTAIVEFVSGEKRSFRIAFANLIIEDVL